MSDRELTARQATFIRKCVFNRMYGTVTTRDILLATVRRSGKFNENTQRTIDAAFPWPACRSMFPSQGGNLYSFVHPILIKCCSGIPSTYRPGTWAAIFSRRTFEEIMVSSVAKGNEQSGLHQCA